MKLVVSDGHKGIRKAVDKSFLGASWQMCHVHLIRAVLRNDAKKYHKEIADLSMIEVKKASHFACKIRYHMVWTAP